MRGLKRVIWTLAVASGTLAAEQRYTFQTPQDHFELVVRGTAGSVDGKPANMASFGEIQPLLTQSLTAECTSVPNSPAPFTVKTANGTRSIYPKSGLVTDGKNCLNVAGDGLHYLPLHRDFFVGPKRGAITLKSPVKVFRDGKKVIDLKRKGKEWANENGDQLLDWDFLWRLENSLRDFGMRLRVQDTITEGKSKMLIQSGDQTFEFYKITNVLWAVKRPGAKWLEASDDWSFWHDFDESEYEDRNRTHILTARDQSRSRDERMAALERLDVTWSPNLRRLYQDILLRPDEQPEFQALALKRLKRKPSHETAGVLIRFLEESQNADLKREAGMVLKSNNPKGPKYNPDAPEEEKHKALEFWRNWWKSAAKDS